MAWFDTVKTPKLKKAKKAPAKTPNGLWKKCTNCAEILQVSKLVEQDNVCPYCGHHYRINAQKRLDMLVDEGSFNLMGEGLSTTDPLEFKDKKTYQQRLSEAQEKFGKTDGTLCGLAKVHGHSCAIAVMDFFYMGGSMGAITGEKIAFTMDLACELKIPAIVVSCSGGARMQEGLISLMQMAKTSATRKRMQKLGLPYISVLTDPTTGGCAASYAMLGDVNISEPNALIGFAGPRVIEQSIRQKLPEGFQRAEFLKDHGQVDLIVHRFELKDKIAFFLSMFCPSSYNRELH
jgi:acetyl-CoA carboxylase carboxyl transferase subunit beta